MYMARISVAGDVLWKEPMGEIDDVAKGALQYSYSYN